MGETPRLKREHQTTDINEEEEVLKIKNAIAVFLNGNFFLKNLISRAPNQLHIMLEYIPEIIMILKKDNRGLEILKVTGIYEFLREK